MTKPASCFYVVISAVSIVLATFQLVDAQEDPGATAADLAFRQAADPSRQGTERAILTSAH